MPDLAAVGLPDILSFEDWIRGTSRALSPRSTTLRALDNALKGYNVMRNPQTLATLRIALTHWKSSKGNDPEAWRRDPRNADHAVTRLNAQLMGLGDSDAATGSIIPAADMENARLGILYLFGNLAVDSSAWSIGTTAVFETTLAGFAFTNTDTNQAAGYANKALTAAKPVAGAGAKFAEAQYDAYQTANAAAAMPTTRPRSTVSVSGPAPFADAAVAPTTRARANAMIGGHPPTLPPVTRPRANAMVVEQPATRARSNAISGGPAPFAELGMVAQVRQALNSLVLTVKTKLSEAATKIGQIVEEHLYPILKDLNKQKLAMVPMQIRTIVEALVGQFAKSAAPFVGAGLDLAKGVVKLIDACIDRYRMWANKDVKVVEGHPTTILKAIESAMDLSLCEGLFQTLSSGARLGVDIASAGAGVIVTFVMKAVETLGRAIWKIYEVATLKTFVDEAKSLWERRHEMDALQSRPLAFDQWYKKFAIKVPAIAVLSLNSGVVGDKMRFLSMMTGGSLIAQKEFDRGVGYLDSLKAWGVTYLLNVDIEFSSTNESVKGFLALAKSHIPEKQKHQKVWAVLQSVLNGSKYPSSAPVISSS
jgi:hypothetical protein